MLDKPGWSEKYITNDESKNTHNIIDVNNEFVSMIDFLHSIQLMFRNKVSINDSGRIDRSDLLELNILSSENEVIKKMNETALTFYKWSSWRFEWSSDYVVVWWALVCIYDSSKKTPDYFKNTGRWSKNHVAYNWVSFSVLWIDVNKSERTDNVSPDTTLHHEFQHHLNTTLWDELLRNNNKLDFQTANRFSDPTSWFSSKSSYVAEDSELISNMFSDSINLDSAHPSIKTIDYERYENQMFYLDELSASWGQAKSNVFWPKQDFYNNLPWKNREHYKLIWESKIDKEKLKKLFKDYLMPWFYLFNIESFIQNTIDEIKLVHSFDSVDVAFKKAEINKLNEEKEKINKIICKITQTLWVSRTINQALELISKLWKDEIVDSLNHNDTVPYLPDNYDNNINYIYEWWKMLYKYL